MKALAFGLVLGGIVIVSACSSSPSSDCNHAASVYCQHQFSCDAAGSAQKFGNEANCETEFEALVQCAALVCPANTSYHDDKVNACISAVNAQSCTDNSTPTACQGFTTGSVCY